MRRFAFILAALALPGLAFAQAVPGSSTLGLATEDVAHVSGAVGQMCLGVRDDALTVLAGTTGDYIPLMMNSAGALVTSCTLDPSYAEDVAETGGGSVVLAGAIRRDTAASSSGTTGDVSTINVDSTGRLWITGTQIEDSAGTASGELLMCGALRADAAASSSGTDGDNSNLTTDALGRLWTSGGAIEDVAEAGGDGVVLVGTVRRDAAVSSAGTDLDIATLNTDASGAVWSHILGTYAEDSAHTSTENLVGVAAVRNDTLSALAGTDKDYAPLQVTATGGLWVTQTGTSVEDVAATAAGDLVMVGTVRTDVAASSAGTTGDNANLSSDAVGALWTHDTGTWSEDVAEVAGGGLTMAGTVRRVVAATSSGTTGDASTLNTDAIGRLWVSGTALEDVAHTTADQLIPAGLVRSDTLATLAGTTGDYTMGQVDADGALWTHPLGIGVEDVAATAAGNLFMQGAVRRDAATSSSGTDGDNSNVSVDALGRLWTSGGAIEDVAEVGGDGVVLVGTVRRDTQASSAGTTLDVATLNTDASGNLWVTGTYLEDVAEASGQQLVMAGAVRRDAAASSSGTSGDASTLSVDALGKLWTTGSYAEDAAHTTADSLVGVAAVRQDTLAALAGTTGDYSPLSVNAVGAVYTIATGGAAFVCGNENIEAAGTAENLGANACKKVTISCPNANTSDCYVRHNAGNGITGGMNIAQGTTVTLELNNTNLVWVDAGTNDDDVTWCCTN